MTVRERVLDLLFPPKCPFCQKILAEPRAPVCPECRPGLPWLEGAAGERQVDFADGCFSPLAYRGTVPQAVHRYKFSRVRALGKPFAALMTQCLSDRLPERADLLCWAPLSKKRLLGSFEQYGDFVIFQVVKWMFLIFHDFQFSCHIPGTRERIGSPEVMKSDYRKA